MLQLFDTHAALFKSWHVVRYEQEGEAYLLQLSALLQDWPGQVRWLNDWR